MKTRDNESLQGRRIAVLASDGFEKVEFSVPVKALQIAGAKTDVISLRQGRIRGVNLHELASRVRVTKTLDEAHPSDYEGLLLLRWPALFTIPKASGPEHSRENAGAGDLRLNASELALIDETFPRGSRPRHLPML